MNGKYVIVDVENQRFVQCLTEDKVVFLTRDIMEAEVYKTPETAIIDARRYTDNKNRFLSSENTGTRRNQCHVEINVVKLVPCKVEAKYKFIPVETKRRVRDELKVAQTSALYCEPQNEV